MRKIPIKTIKNAVKNETITNEISAEFDGDETSLDDYRNQLKKEDIEDRRSDRKLKKQIKRNVMDIVDRIMMFCILVLVFDVLYFAQNSRHIYSEWFLATLLGSQLVVLPFGLLLVITQSLFPKESKTNK